MTNFLRLFFVVIGISLFSCDKNRVYDTYQTVPLVGWHKDSVMSFNLKNVDTITNYNLFINLRADQNYPYNNLFLETTISFPYGKEIVDTLEYKMAHPDGRLLGQGTGSLKESKLWLREEVRFPEQGQYTLKIKQLMRAQGEIEPLEYLPGITEIGVRIEQVTP
ncbi:gliding motility lipoprotein GldH [Mesonia sp. HuA40]|uniref:gliding motility lipoprotein GldH n=1 Tax=Mesonia sp. HuA40 TaxID=2602761 RepID=UPI0011C8E344|nr:gliding motility lipoprotein GldH [Mesonia sp. HuA40]TXK72683.1 gliding motility lipoprotein GldH [Mesonia sp. HuA40]